MKVSHFRPVLLDSLRGYNPKKLMADLSAGLTVGIVALPLAIGFAIASGVNPRDGLITAVVAGFLISALGGSRFQIGGPTGAFVPIVFGIVATYGFGNLLICTFMAGVILLAMGLSGLGKLIKYIPYPVTMGFTSGIAVIIFLGQVPNFLGLNIKVPADFFEKIGAIAGAIGTTNWVTLFIGIACFALIMKWPARFQRVVPASIVALVIATLAVWLFRLNVATITSTFGEIPQGFPGISVPKIQWESVKNLIGPAFTIAILCAIESLLSAVVADGLTNDRHDSNQELMGQGIANMLSPLFGGIPATGAIARTATNIRNGAQSPISGIVHAGVLFLVMLVAAPLVGTIPLVSLAAVLMVTALRMGEWNEFRRLRKVPVYDAVVFLSVFALTVIADLTVAVAVGMILAALLFIKRMMDMSSVQPLDESHPSNGGRPIWADESWPDGVFLFRIQGAFFFGTADKLETAFRRAGEGLRVMILCLNEVITLDATGLNALESLQERLSKRGRHLVLCSVPPRVREMMDKSGFLATLGEEHLAPSIEDGLDKARSLLYARPDEKPALAKD